MRDILKTIEEQLTPAHTALVVIDMQNDFCSPDGFLAKERNQDTSTNKIIADNIMCLVQAGRGVGMEIVWVRAIYDYKYLPEPHVAKSPKEGLCMESTWGVDFYEVQPVKGELIVDKHCYSAFSGTDFDRQLRNRGIRTLLMTGVATNVCVDSTLRDGFFLGYYVVVAEDCVGAANKEGHEGTLSTVRYTFGSVLPSQEIIQIIHGRHAAAAAE